MKIEKIYIGGWFQRTLLHLTEIYDFLRDGSSRLNLSEAKISKNRELLDIKEVSFEIEGFEYVKFTTNSGINVKILEDGLIVLNHDSNINSFKQDISNLTDYYENAFSPAISYLFSLGAPVPKELAKIKTVYPYFVVLKEATEKTINDLLATVDKQKYSNYKSSSFEVSRGEKYFLISAKKTGISTEKIESYIEENIFFREFKGQLHRYLNLHRMIWEEIAEIKERDNIKAKDINRYTTKLDEYSKTINLVETRINQMGTYLKTREKIAKNNAEFKNILGVMEYSYETLGNSLLYIQQIWAMTKNYVKSAHEQYVALQNKVTQRALNNLTIVTALAGCSALMIALTRTEWPEFSWWGVLFAGCIIGLAFVFTRGIRWLSGKGKYKIANKDYEDFKEK